VNGLKEIHDTYGNKVLYRANQQGESREQRRYATDRSAMRALDIVRVSLCATVFASVAICASESTSTFTLPTGVIVSITEAPFEKSKFKVVGCADNEPCLIQGRVPFGVAGQAPKSYVKRITVTVHGKTYALESSDMYDAWGHRPLEMEGVGRYFGGGCTSDADCQFRGLFSDASGAFVAEWRVVSGKSFRTVLTSSDDIMTRFATHIDPPEDN
jgi:hypothetical protein